MTLEPALDRLHARAVANRWLRLFAAVTRGLLAFGFVLPGFVKLQGRFTRLPVTTPVGAFFEAFFQAHEFYVFVGVAQMLAAALLLFRRTTTLGAVLYFPIILNICVITWAIDFQGTKFITAMMLLAAAFLLCWDYDRWKTLLPGFTPAARVDLSRHLGIGYVILGAAAASLLALGVFTAFAFDQLLVSIACIATGAVLAFVAVRRTVFMSPA